MNDNFAAVDVQVLTDDLGCIPRQELGCLSQSVLRVSRELVRKQQKCDVVAANSVDDLDGHVDVFTLLSKTGLDRNDVVAWRAHVLVLVEEVVGIAAQGAKSAQITRLSAERRLVALARELGFAIALAGLVSHRVDPEGQW